MRALLLNPEMPKSFWTFEQSCELSEAKALMPPLGLLTVASLLPTEWEIRLIDLNARGLSEKDWEWSDMVMISGMVVQSEGMLELCRQAKQRDKTVVVGGPYVTSVPDALQDSGADFLILGEGESIMQEFLASLRSGEKSGFFREREKPDMTLSPIPRFDLLHLKDYAIWAVQTSRGCPFDCEFCDIVNLYGRKPRYKTPEQLLAELEYFYRLGWREEIFISDDNFIGNKTHAKAILHKLIQWMKAHGEPFTFWAQASVNLGQDPELIDLMTEANFHTVFIGIESPDESVLTGTRKFHNVANPLGESLDNIKRNGLSVMASFVIGLDHEQKGAGKRICEFVEQNEIPSVMLNTLQVLPNTALWERLKREGRLLQDRTSGQSTGGRFNYVPSRPESEIIEEYLEAVNRLYEPSGYLSRSYGYFLAMRPTRHFLATGETRPPSDNDRSFAERMRELRSLLRLIWWQGIMSPYRLQFWRQLVGMFKNNPTRTKKYLVCLATGENMFRMRQVISERLNQK
ncbi:MAG: B12-binding domain-containing radical SAM protein [Desulfomonile tiedjei]|uniref:B12-binding domain-containing radical SAM protein n=1 Tax=Desulfomonile tiedjei TaxID=2358 RepID=A0A9D6V7Y7_9BACT|nr:B12-binding domain-containing radical SAM protein [Desulfomonile tiedjei]